VPSGGGQVVVTSNGDAVFDHVRNDGQLPIGDDDDDAMHIVDDEENIIKQRLHEDIINLFNAAAAGGDRVEIKAENLTTASGGSIGKHKLMHRIHKMSSKRSLNATLARLQPVRMKQHTTPNSMVRPTGLTYTPIVSEPVEYKISPLVTADDGALAGVIGPDDLTCRLCGKSFTVRANRIRHEATSHTDHRAFPCTVCEKDFKRKDQLRSHMQHRHGQDLVRERRRDSPFSAQQQQQQQQQLLAPPPPPIQLDELSGGPSVSPITLDSPPPPAGTVYDCDLCDRRYTRRDHLRRHRQLMHRGVHEAFTSVAAF
jgi:hypothetical protein